MEKRGRLFIIGTPIGNLQDITLRALSIIESCQVVFCEDTRVSRKLLTRYNLRKKLVSLHGDSPSQALEKVGARLERGENVCYMTDAGMPGVSDPAASLVELCQRKEFGVTVIPGVSAVTTALSYSPKEISEFLFLGFPGSKSSDIDRKLMECANSRFPIIFFVPPHDLENFLRRTKTILGEREILLCRELTKKFEQVVFGRTSEILEKVEGLKRGEITLIIYPLERLTDESEKLELDLGLAIERLLGSGFSPRECVKILSCLAPKLKNIVKRKIYN